MVWESPEGIAEYKVVAVQTLSSAIVIVFWILTAATFTFNGNESGHFSHAKLSTIAAANNNTQMEWPRSVTDKNLVHYTLELINNNRGKYNLPLNLSKNKATQIHANVLEDHNIPHMVVQMA